MVDVGSEENMINVPAAGLANIRLTQKVPPNIKRIFTFGNIMLEGGAARNFQIFSTNERTGRRFAMSPNDAAVKSLEGMQVLNQDFVLEVDVAGEADGTVLVWSISYIDVAVRKVL